ncbi:MAG: PD-(D/E)XK nuclease family protein [Promethearchaeota archaeon]
MNTQNEYFKSAPILPFKIVKPFRNYSITGDILAYKTCPRQYGFFKQRNFIPSSSGQIFFGEIIHKVLDHCHRHYKQNKKIPTCSELENYFIEVEKSLLAHGIRYLSKGLRDRALFLLQLFNLILGELTYPTILDTECSLKKLQTIPQDDSDFKYIMNGVVDVIKLQNNQIEIWDYKGGRKNQHDRMFKEYINQIIVYTYLYQNQYGSESPVDRGRIVFVGEMDNLFAEKTKGTKKTPLEYVKDILLEEKPSETNTQNPENIKKHWSNISKNHLLSLLNKEPEDILKEISICETLHPEKIQNVIQDFDFTVLEIEKELAMPFHQQWSIKNKDPPHSDTCKACELRWSCENPNGKYRLKAL